MEVKIKQGNEMLDATIEMVDGVMVVSPKEVKFGPKDGDVIWIQDGLSIFKRWVAPTLFYSYVTVFDSGYISVDFGKFIRKYIRPATEEEKQKLFDRLKEEGYEFDFEKKELVKLRWKPKMGERYFTPFINGYKAEIASHSWNNDLIDERIYKLGFVFKTKEECQEFCKRLNDAISQVKP